MGLTAVNHYPLPTTCDDPTCDDMLRVSRNHSTASDTMRYEDGRVQPLHNTNKLLWSLPGADGVKTGTTTAAGQCLIASATRFMAADRGGLGQRV